MQQGPVAPWALPHFLATVDPSDSLSPSDPSRVSPLAGPTLLRRFPVGTRRASPVDSTRPCHRAAATTPPEGTPEARGGRSLLPSPTGDRLGLRICHSRGYLRVHSRCGPVTRSPPRRWLRRWASDQLVSLLTAIQATGLLALAPVGLAPTERVSLVAVPGYAQRSPFQGAPGERIGGQGETGARACGTVARDEPWRAISVAGSLRARASSRADHCCVSVEAPGLQGNVHGHGYAGLAG